MTSNWKIQPLGEIATFKSGGTPNKSKNDYWGGDLPWVSAKDLKSPVITDSINHLSPVGFTIAKIAPANSLLILVRGMTLHKDVPVCLTGRDVAFNQDIKALVPSEQLDPKYLLYFLHSKKNRLLDVVESAGHGTGRLNTESLKAFPVAVPPLHEQTAIADLLSTWDAAIEKTEKLIAAKEKRLNALYQLFFQPGMPANSSWRFAKIGQFMTPRRERAVPSEEIPLFSLTIEDGVTPKTDRYNRDFLVKDNGSKTYKVVYPGDIVFNPSNLRWGAIARSHVEHKVAISPIYEVLEIKTEKIDPGFLEYALTCPRQIGIFATRAEGTLIERMAVKLDAFLLTEILVPSNREEQQEVASFLNLARKEIELLKRQAAAYRKQKRGLMQKLLTGDWRLNTTLEKETCV